MSLFRIDAAFPAFFEEAKVAQRNYPSFKSDLGAAFEHLERSPRTGDAIPRVGPDLFKIRLGVKGRFGKRGGYRLIYHVDWSREVVTPVALYFKRDTPKLSDAVIIGRLEQVAQYIAQYSVPAPSTPPPTLN